MHWALPNNSLGTRQTRVQADPRENARKNRVQAGAHTTPKCTRRSRVQAGQAAAGPRAKMATGAPFESAVEWGRPSALSSIDGVGNAVIRN